MPMDKNSTPSTIISQSQMPDLNMPAKETIAKIKQFARAYSFAQTSNHSLGNLVLN